MPNNPLSWAGDGKLAMLLRGFQSSKRVRTLGVLTIFFLLLMTFTYHSSSKISGPISYSHSSASSPPPTAEDFPGFPPNAKDQSTKNASKTNGKPPKGAIDPQLNEPTTLPPILGEGPDALRMYYPPIGEPESWQPKPGEHNTRSHQASRTRTPMLIPFTRNNAMLVQTVLSLIGGAGWPREDIVVIDNTGTMDANPNRLLTKDNPLYLDVHTLRTKYGVSVIQTPTLLTFSQLQNYMLRLAMIHKWKFFFWAHSDIIVTSDEFSPQYKSFHQRAVEELDDVGFLIGQKLRKPRLAAKFFNGDWIALIIVEPWKLIGGWDNFIPYYSSDCDAYARIKLSGFVTSDVFAGRIFDVGSVLPDIEKKLFRNTMIPLDWSLIFEELENMEKWKDDHRNEWQTTQKGGRGEPWTYDPEGFQKMWWWTSRAGKDNYRKKWGTKNCDPKAKGGKLNQLWNLGIWDKIRDWWDEDLPLGT